MLKIQSSTVLATCKQRPQTRYHTFHCSCLRIYEYTNDLRVVSESCERVATVPCACVHLSDCFPVEGHILESGMIGNVLYFSKKASLKEDIQVTEHLNVS